MEPIKVVRIAYKYDLTIPAQVNQYESLCRALTNNGYKKFSALWISNKNGFVPRDKYEDATLDQSTIFDNQFNTIEGERVFDWNEPIFENRNIRMGYYISLSTKQAIDAYRSTMVKCSFCGHKEQKSEKVFCDKCLGSQYLKESELHLTRLVSVLTPCSERGKNLSISPEHREMYRIAQLQQKIEYIRQQAERRNKKIVELKETLKKEIEQKTYKCEIQCMVLEAGFDIDNLIYYAHKNEWVWGWNKPLSQEESEIIRSANLPFDFTIKMKDGTTR